MVIGVSFEPSRFFLKGKMRQNTNIHEHKSEQKLVKCEINTKEKGTKSRVLGPGTGGQKRDYT